MEWSESRIDAIVQETPMDRSFTLRIPRGEEAAYAFVPGQFLLVRDPDHPESGQRAYTISSAPGEGTGLDLTVRDMGRFGHQFYDLPLGKLLLVRPPQGRFVLDLDSGDDLVLVAGGSGVTPFRSFVRHLRALRTQRTVCLVQSARRREELVFREEFERHASELPWFDYLPTVTRADASDPWRGRRGRVDEDLLASRLPEPGRALLYTCGPGEFVKATLAMAEAVGVPADRRRKEQWG